jgi:hypothetical protein
MLEGQEHSDGLIRRDQSIILICNRSAYLPPSFAASSSFSKF